MPRVLCLLLSLCFIDVSVYASTMVGFRSGVNSAGASYEPDDGTAISRRTGALFGGIVEGPFNANESVIARFEVTFVQKNWKDEFVAQHIRAKGSYNTAEIALSPFLILRAKPTKIIPYVEAGPEVGWVVQKDSETEVMGYTLDGNLADYYSDSNIALNLGAGAYLPHRQNDFQVGMRYNLGLKNMHDGVSDFKLKINQWQFFLAYLFSTKKQ